MKVQYNKTNKSKSSNQTVSSVESITKRCKIYCGRDIILKPIRTLLYIPVQVVQTIQENIIPTVLLKHGYEIFSKNFGFSRAKVLNNFLLIGMVSCMVSKVWVNRHLDKTEKDLNAIWLQADNTTISEANYDKEFDTCLWEFFYAVGIKSTVDVFNKLLKFLLNNAIVFKDQCDLTLKLFSDYNIYDINDNENAETNENPGKEKVGGKISRLYDDVSNQTGLIGLWNTRINTMLDCATALYDLNKMSPSFILPLYFFPIQVPQFIVLSLAYSLAVSILFKIVERPMIHCFERMNRLKDLIANQIINAGLNGGNISFLDGEAFESHKLIDSLGEEHKAKRGFHFAKSAKFWIREATSNIEWLVPILVLLKSVRNGSIAKNLVITFTRNLSYVTKGLNWSSKNFKKIKKIDSSVGRLKDFKKGREIWKSKRIEIEKKLVDSPTVGFSGIINLDAKGQRKITGNFTLGKGTITHLKGTTGCGKTTVLKVFRGIWEHFEGNCTLPKGKTFFLPSTPYILGPDEPLLQTICYPRKIHSQNNNKSEDPTINSIKTILKKLHLREHIYNNLVNLSSIGNQKAKVFQTTNWLKSLSDGERKRIAFCNILLKLKTQEIKFLVLDEPFNSVDVPTQKIMVDLLRETLKDKSSLSNGCTVLYSNHEENHGLNTHVLQIEDDKIKLGLIK